MPPAAKHGIAASIIRQSDESMSKRVSTARSFARYFALVDGDDFNLDVFLDDCFAADLASWLGFDVELHVESLHVLTFTDGSGTWEHLASDLTDAEASAFEKLEGLDG